MVDCTDGMSVPLTLRFSTAPPNPALTPAQRDSSATLPWSWMTQTTFLAPSAASLLPAASPEICSSWPKYALAPAAFQSSMPALSATTRDPCRDRALQRGLHGFRACQRDRDRGDLAVNGVLHQVRLVGSLKLGRVLQVDVVLLGGGLGAFADEIPEGVAGRPVGDHRDREARGIGLAGAHTRIRWTGACRRCSNTPSVRRRTLTEAAKNVLR